jgi:predicted permease
MAAGAWPGELRLALRSLARMPLLTAVVVVSLGVGIGANTVVFSWIQALVLRPLPGVADASLFHVIETVTETGSRPGASWPEYQDLRERIPSIPDLVAFRMAPFNLGDASRNERTYGLLVSGNYFQGLGLSSAAGRLLAPSDVARPGAEPVVVISYDFWQHRFGGATGAIGRTLRVNERDLTIVGVTPEGFQGTVLALQFDLWLPATMAPVLMPGSRELEERSVRGYAVMGRLSGEATRAQAQAEVSAALGDLAAAYPSASRGFRAEVLPFWRATRGPPRMLIDALAVLQGVMLVLLLAVCGNTANLLLARASARQREMGIRLAMGAGPWRVTRVLLVENLVMASGAAAVGALLAFWGTNALRAAELLSTAFPVRLQTEVDLYGLLFAFALAVLAALVFGAAPAWHLARVQPLTVLRTTAATAPRGALRQALMGVEVALALVVMLAAGLFFRSFAETRTTDPGFDRHGVLLAAYDFSSPTTDAASAREFAARLLDRVRALRTVEAAALATSIPLDIHGLPSRAFVLEGRARTDGAVDRSLSNVVTSGYFVTMRIPLVAGADFAPLDDPTSAAQAIVNVAFVRRFIGEGEAIGRRIESGGRTYVITGVVRDSISDAFGEPATPCVYYSFRDRPSPVAEIHVRTRVGAESALGPELRAIVRELAPSLPLYNVRTLDEHVETNLFLRRIPARMFVVLGPLILLLAVVGIYAVVDYTVAQRTTEIGVRLALGATAGGVVRQIVVESLMTVSLGALAGLLGVLAVYSHLMRGALDLPVFAGVPLALFAAAALACWLPARRATLVDPVVALRAE